jgi:hypothetical protein
MDEILKILRKGNSDSLKAINSCLVRLKQMRIGADPDTLDDILAEIADAQTEITRLQIIGIHLKAAGVKVRPMSTEELQSLDRLAGKIDAAIISNTIFTANLDFLKGVLDSVREFTQVTDDLT